MEDLIRFGRLTIGIFSLLFAAFLAISRLYIHQFKKWMRRAHREI